MLSAQRGCELLPRLLVLATQQGQSPQRVAWPRIARRLGDRGPQVGLGGLQRAELLPGQTAEEQGLRAQQRPPGPRTGLARPAAQRLLEGRHRRGVLLTRAELGTPAEPELAAAGGRGSGQQRLGLLRAAGAVQQRRPGEHRPVPSRQCGQGGRRRALALCVRALPAAALQPVQRLGRRLGLGPRLGALRRRLEEGEHRRQAVIGGRTTGGPDRLPGELAQAPPGQLPGRLRQEREGLAVERQCRGGIAQRGRGVRLPEQGQAALGPQPFRCRRQPPDQPGIPPPGLLPLPGPGLCRRLGERAAHRGRVQGASVPNHRGAARTDQHHHEQQQCELRHAPSPCRRAPPVRQSRPDPRRSDQRPWAKGDLTLHHDVASGIRIGGPERVDQHNGTTQRPCEVAGFGASHPWWHGRRRRSPTRCPGRPSDESIFDYYVMAYE